MATVHIKKNNPISGQLHIMKNINTEISLTPEFDLDGRLDVDSMVEKVIEATSDNLGISIFNFERSSENDQDIARKIVARTIKRCIEPIKDIVSMFDKDGTVYQNEDGNYFIPLVMKGSGWKFELEYRETENGEPDREYIIKQIEDAYRNVLRSNCVSPLNTKQKKDMASQVSKFKNLVEEGSRNKASECIVEVLDGSKLKITKHIGEKPFIMEILFSKKGICLVENMIYRKIWRGDNCYIERKLELDDYEKENVKEKIGLALEKAIRDEKYSHPYTIKTKKRVLECKYAITSAAEKTKISPLAIAGAVADRFDDSYENRLKMRNEEMAEIAAMFAKKNHKDIYLLLTHFSGVGKGLVKTAEQSFGLWSAEYLEQELDEKTKKEMLMIAVKFCAEVLLEHIDDMTFRGWLNHNLDSANIGTTVAELTKLAEKVEMTHWERIQNRLKYGSINLALISSKNGLDSFFVYDKAIRSGKLKNEAKEIQRTIDECSQSNPYRNKITKWERFYKYFS